MKIDLWGDRAHTQTVSIPGSIEELGVEIEDITFIGDYRVICTIQRDSEIARVVCGVTAPAMIICSRCLAEYQAELSGKFEFVAKRLKLGEELPVEEDVQDVGEDIGDLVFVPYGEISVDISQYVLDALVLSIPLKTLCKEDCMGLCQQCGADLNERRCDCTPVPIDERWSTLSSLIQESDKREN